MFPGGFRTARGGCRLCVTGAGVFVLAVLPLLAAQRGGAAASVLPRLPPGDAARGKALVESSKCLDCHRVGGTGSRLGPDLSDIGKLRSADELQRALVAPDDEVLPEQRFVRIVTRDGTTVVGRLLNQDAFSIQLMNAAEQLKSYGKSNLREYTILDKGMMPSFDGKLTPQGLGDVVRYLESLTGDEK